MSLTPNSPDGSFYYVIDTERGTNATPATKQDVDAFRQRLVEQQRAYDESLKPKNTIPQTEIPTLNNTAASPNAITLGIPGLVVIGGIIALFILGRKN